MRTIRVKRLRSLVIAVLVMSILMVQLALSPSASAQTDMTKRSGNNEYLISTDNGAWIGHAAHDFVNSSNETVYCVQPSATSKDSLKNVEDALNYLPQDVITKTALGIESIRGASIDEYTKSALLQAWVWMNVNGHKGCFTDKRVDEMYSMRGADRETQRNVIAEARRYADENAGKFVGKGLYYKGSSAEQSQVLFTLSPLEGTAELKKETGGRSKLFSTCPKIYSLAGAIYHVLDSNGRLVAELVTDKDGNTDTKSLKPGRYKAKEISAPDNMGLDPNEHEFEVKANEKFVIRSNDEPLAAKIDVLIKKKAAESNQDKTLSLAGAEFTVEYFASLDDEPGNLERKWIFITDKEGQVKLDALYLKDGSDELYTDDDGKPLLPVGTYRINETKAPKGFWINKEVKTIKLKPVNDENGKISISKYEVPIFEEKEQTVRVRVKKLSEGDAKPLAGARFDLKRIADADGKAVNKLEEAQVEKLITGEDGIAEKAGLLPGIYELKETKSPDGYAISKEIHRIEAKGTEGDTIVTGTDGKSEFLYESQIGNAKIKLEISKLTLSNGKKHSLSGAELLLKDSDGKIVDRWISDGNPHRIEGIKEGRYTIIEEKAPQGYERLSSPVEINVENTAEVQHFDVNNEKTPDKPNTGDLPNIGGYVLSLVSGFILFWILTGFGGKKNRL